MTRLLFLLLLLLAVPALAQPMRCSGRLVEAGVSMAAVAELCGAPDSRRDWTEVVPAGDDDEGIADAARIPMAEWVYDDDDDPDQFANKVLFRNGMVAEVRN